MITAMHSMIFAEDADKARAFLRDVLGFRHVDAGGGWLIFAMPPTEMGVHPLEPHEKPKHQLYFVCDDIHATVKDLTAKGVEFTMPVNDEGWGWMTAFTIPGGGEMGLYQPKHPSPLQATK